MFFYAKYWTGHQYFHKTGVILLEKKSIPNWHLFITQMEMKWTKWYAMTSHVIAYRSLELLFGTHTFRFNCFFEDFNCIFTQIRCLSRVLREDPNITEIGPSSAARETPFKWCFAGMPMMAQLVALRILRNTRDPVQYC